MLSKYCSGSNQRTNWVGLLYRPMVYYGAAPTSNAGLPHLPQTISFKGQNYI